MKKLLVLAIGAALLGSASSAFAITDEEGNASLQFNFSPPGARSLGMGGAFLALADDATAAFTNPAGLVQLASPEISLEVRQTNYNTQFVEAGNFATNPFDTGALTYGNSKSDVRNISFLSWVIPMDNWALALYRHEFLNFETSFASLAPESSDSDLFIRPFGAAIDVNTMVNGISGALKVGDKLSLGLSLNHYEFEIDSATVRVARTAPFATIFTTRQFGDSNAFGFNLGARYQFNDQWQFGAVYRRAPKFSYEAARVNPDGAVSFVKNSSFDAPDVFGVGATWRPLEAVTVSLDINHVSYSDLTDDGVDSNFVLDDSAFRSSLDPLDTDDGIEIRLGGEYTFTNFQNPFSIRAGIWKDPEHTLRFEGAPGTGVDAVANAVLFSIGDDEIHYAAGFGWAFEKFQLDAAADFSDRVDAYSVSGVWRF
jgi:long-chain fatty acid transport protein